MKKRLQGSRHEKPSDSIGYLYVPLELSYRYPGLFSREQLESGENILLKPPVPLTAKELEKARFCWEFLYAHNQSPSADFVRELGHRFASFHKPIKYKFNAARTRKKVREMKLDEKRDLQKRTGEGFK